MLVLISYGPLVGCCHFFFVGFSLLAVIFWRLLDACVAYNDKGQTTAAPQTPGNPFNQNVTYQRSLADILQWLRLACQRVPVEQSARANKHPNPYQDGEK